MYTGWLGNILGSHWMGRRRWTWPENFRGFLETVAPRTLFRVSGRKCMNGETELIVHSSLIYYESFKQSSTHHSCQGSVTKCIREKNSNNLASVCFCYQTHHLLKRNLVGVCLYSKLQVARCQKDLLVFFLFLLLLFLSPLMAVYLRPLSGPPLFSQVMSCAS